MAGLLTPTLLEIQTALRATLNTEKDALDSSLADVASESIRIEHPRLFREQYPWVNIFPFGESEIGEESEDSNKTNTIFWNIITHIEISGENTEDLLKDIDAYAWGMAKSIIKHGADWTLNGICDRLVLERITHDAFEGEEEGSIVIGNFLIWTFDKEYTLTS